MDRDSKSKKLPWDWRKHDRQWLEDFFSGLTAEETLAALEDLVRVERIIQGVDPTHGMSKGEDN